MAPSYGMRRPPDTKVMFGVSYTDGRTAYIRVGKEAAGDYLAVKKLAHAEQADGAIPAGTITSVKRVR